uniref:Uncharacterized protein n=1 Tax=Arundo donax TaxID=35708 RepID=A0A0A9A6U9_ARUDO
MAPPLHRLIASAPLPLLLRLHATPAASAPLSLLLRLLTTPATSPFVEVTPSAACCLLVPPLRPIRLHLYYLLQERADRPDASPRSAPCLGGDDDSGKEREKGAARCAGWRRGAGTVKGDG